MANQNPLASWLYSKRDELNPKFKEFNWPRHWYMDIFDFSTTITWGGMTAEGRGVDERREVALEKSVAEALERLICLKNGIDSVGLAVAGTHDPADHARNEALERFYLNQHIQNKIPFQVIDDHCPMAHEFKKAHPTSTVAFYRMTTQPDSFGVVCLMTSQETQKSSLGFALSKSLGESMRRTMLEALPSYVWIVDEATKGEVPNSLPWHIAPEFLDQILPLLNEAHSSRLNTVLKAPALRQLEVSFDDISVLTTAPIHAVRFVAATEETA